MGDEPETAEIRVLIADEIVRIVEGMDQLATADGRVTVCGVARSPASLFAETRQLQPDIILLNETFRGIDAMAAAHELNLIAPGSRTVLISPDPAAAEARGRAIRAGIREFLPATAGIDEIVAAIMRARADALGIKEEAPTASAEPMQPLKPRKVRKGSHTKAETFLIFSGKGGVGKSVLATNLAVALSAERDARVALVDLDLQFGDIRVMLNVDFPTSIDFLAQQGDQVDAELLEDCLAESEDQVRILLAPPSPELADLVTTANLRAILRELTKSFDYVVIDTASHLDERTLEAIEHADQIIVMTSFSVTAVKNTKISLKLLASLGVDKEKVAIVLNQTRAKVPFPKEEVEENLRFRVISTLPFDPKTVDDAVDEGRPFFVTDSKAEITRQIRALVDYLVPRDEEVAAEAAEERGPTSKVAKRRFSLGRG